MLQNIHRIELFATCCRYLGHLATRATFFDFCRLSQKVYFYTFSHIICDNSSFTKHFPCWTKKFAFQVKTKTTKTISVYKVL